MKKILLILMSVLTLFVLTSCSSCSKKPQNNNDDTIVTNPDNSVSVPDGTVTKPDGTVIMPDGTTKAPDGTVTSPDGTIKSPDGTITSPDGTVIKPDGSITKPDGTVTPPDDTKKDPDPIKPVDNVYYLEENFYTDKQNLFSMKTPLNFKKVTDYNSTVIITDNLSATMTTNVSITKGTYDKQLSEYTQDSFEQKYKQMLGVYDKDSTSVATFHRAVVSFEHLKIDGRDAVKVVSERFIVDSAVKNYEYIININDKQSVDINFALTTYEDFSESFDVTPCINSFKVL